MSLSVVNWNVEWATPASARSPEILRRIESHNPDIVCLTETDLRLLAAWDGRVIAAGPEQGKLTANNRRKVALWSREGWADADELGNAELPPGRFISGSTETSIGRVTVIGVCIPYHNANVNVGNKNRIAWQEHASYLRGLSMILKSRTPTQLIMIGDFNQQLGQRRNPYPPLSQPVRAELQTTMLAGQPPGLTIITAGLGLRGRRAIDHIAVSGELSAASLGTLDNLTHDGAKLSDHFGVHALLNSRTNPQAQNPVE
ncbi:MAG: endonuclease/exonuclease/phosphatase family protein [Chloroflexi bacterium]|nr:endonuclease/exonuclease/phosphatase family protein [Chloroflexota bacterium]